MNDSDVFPEVVYKAGLYPFYVIICYIYLPIGGNFRVLMLVIGETNQQSSDRDQGKIKVRIVNYSLNQS
jgi:hypothetical protein